MSAGLRARLRRLEGAGGRRDDPREGPLVVLPVGLAAEDTDALIVRHRQRAGWSGTVVVLPSNSRETQQPQPRPAASGPKETDHQ